MVRIDGQVQRAAGRLLERYAGLETSPAPVPSPGIVAESVVKGLAQKAAKRVLKEAGQRVARATAEKVAKKATKKQRARRQRKALDGGDAE